MRNVLGNTQGAHLCIKNEQKLFTRVTQEKDRTQEIPKIKNLFFITEFVTPFQLQEQPRRESLP
jgi:hypothetical protein